MTLSRSPDHGDTAPTPVDQNRFGAEEGNCLAACVATLTGLDLELLTERIGNGEGGGYVDGKWVGEHWWDRFCREMNALGFDVGYSRTDVPAGFCVMSGQAERGLLHSTVALNGELWHDPHPSRAGILSVEDYITLAPRLVSEKAERVA